MSAIYNYCHIVGKTDVGRKRAANEDSMCNAETQNGLVSVVCDGMGGHVGGATASNIAVSTIIDNLNSVFYEDPRVAIGESIDRANKAIIQKTVEQPQLAGMGSTCVMLLVRDGKVYIGHVGDSRIYLIRSRRIVQLTKDHSYVQMLVDCGEITKEEAEHHPRKNEITNALGIPTMSPATVAEDAIIPEAGDCFVLCSDGLSGMVPDHTICKVISNQSEMGAQDRVDRLVALANENGGLDNITVQLVEFSVSPDKTNLPKPFPNWAKVVSGIFLLAALSTIGYMVFSGKISKKNGKADTLTENASDTIDYTCPELITFEKGKKIIELEFGNSYLALKRDKGREIDRIEFSFNYQSLKVFTPNVKVEYNNSLLSFTDKTPGDSVVFCITQSDRAKVHRCIVRISNNSTAFSSLNLNPPAPIKKEIKKNPEESVQSERRDTVHIKVEQLKKDDVLRFCYSAKPRVMIGGNEKEIWNDGNLLIDKISDNLSFDKSLWTLSESRNNELQFEFKGEVVLNALIIEIPCSLKDKKTNKSKGNAVIVLSIKVQPKVSEEEIMKGVAQPA